MDPARPPTVQPGYSRAVLTGTNGATVKKPVVKLTEAEIESAQAKIASHVDLPPTEKVKEAVPCGMKGFRKGTCGNVYMTQQFVVFIGKKGAFGESFRIWHWYDILDIYIQDNKIFLVDSSPKVAILKAFPDVASVERAYRAIKRLIGPDDNSVLHQAVDNADIEKIKICLERDVSLLSRVNREEQTPLIKACLKNDIKITKMLLEYYRMSKDLGDGKVDINQKSQRGEHLLHALCRSPDPIEDQILEEILTFPGIDVTCKNNFDNTTPLHYFAQHNRSLKCSELGKLFLKAGADFNACTKFNETPLHKAIFNNKIRVMMVEMLLENKANPAAKGGKREDTPLHYAIRLQRRDLVQKLLEKGGDITVCNNEGADCVQTARGEYEYSPCSATNEILQLLLQIVDLMAFLKRADLDGCTPVFIEHGLQDFDLLCDLNDEDIFNSLKLELKVGPKLKFQKELAELRTSREEARKRKQEEKQKAEVVSALQGKEKHDSEFSNAFRKTLEQKHSGKGGWEISAEELEFTAKLGDGTSGQVFKGLFRGNEVAIKVLKATNVEQELLEFQKEFEILAGLDSPYMIAFYGAVVENYLMMVMELCEKGSLYDVLTKTPKDLSWARAVSFASDMAEGMAVLHNHVPQIIHRDLKSLNLLVTRNFRCKVCDFGLSRLVQGDMKTFGRLCGTFAYASPEVFGGGKATDKSDIFSMGIVLWELLQTAATGKYEQPYAEYNFTMDFQIIVQTAQGLRPSVPTGAQLDFVDLFHECVEGDPMVRPSAQEAARTIRRWKNSIETPEGYDDFRSRVTDQAQSGGSTPAMQAAAQPTSAPSGGFKGWGKK